MMCWREHLGVYPVAEEVARRIRLEKEGVHDIGKLNGDAVRVTTITLRLG